MSSKDRGECARKLRDLRKQIDAGQLPSTTSTTVSKWLEHWVETIVKPNRAPNTYRSYEQVIRLHINPHIGARRLDKLTAEDIRGVYAKTGEKSPRFALLAHQALSRALKQAANEGLLYRNPMQAVEAPGYTPGKRKAFPADIAQQLIQAAFRNGDEMGGTRWATAFLTGARKGELIGLEWDRIDLHQGFIDLSWQMQRLKGAHGCGEQSCGKKYASSCPAVVWKFPPGYEVRQIVGSLWWTRPKTAAGTRIIPISKLPPLLEALRRLKAFDNTNPHGLVFHQPDGRPISPEQHHTDWKALLAVAGLPDAPGHAIRHSTTTMLRKAGVPQDVRMMITGHSSVQAHEIYVHLEHEDAADALGELSAIMPMREAASIDPRYSAVTALNYANETLGS